MISGETLLQGALVFFSFAVFGDFLARLGQPNFDRLQERTKSFRYFVTGVFLALLVAMIF